MPYQDLPSLINLVNKKSKSPLIHILTLTAFVDYVKMWPQKPKPSVYIDYTGPVGVYFIKDANYKYIAAVIDMIQDLHWYILPNSRGKGYLTNGLRDVILPHIFQTRYGSQEITIGDIKMYINFLTRSLWLLQAEIEMNFGSKIYADELRGTVGALSFEISRFQNTRERLDE